MTKTYVVSGRGTKVESALWTVPANVEVHFYFPCMRKPQFYKTRSVLDELILAVGMFPDRVAVAGDRIPAHFVWAHAGDHPPSGVFRRQSGHLAIDLQGSTAQRPVALDHIVDELAGRRTRRATALHWIVRDQETPADAPLPDCMFPPRLRSASADDVNESHHVPLVE
jgi:hypothetical protein